jgi:hypothetical protein
VDRATGFAHIDMVEMGVEHDRRRLTPAADEADEISRLVRLNIIVPETFHLFTDELRDLAFLSGQAFGLNQLLNELDASTDIFHDYQSSL